MAVRLALPIDIAGGLRTPNNTRTRHHVSWIQSRIYGRQQRAWHEARLRASLLRVHAYQESLARLIEEEEPTYIVSISKVPDRLGIVGHDRYHWTPNTTSWGM